MVVKSSSVVSAPFINMIDMDPCEHFETHLDRFEKLNQTKPNYLSRQKEHGQSQRYARTKNTDKNVHARRPSVQILSVQFFRLVQIIIMDCKIIHDN